MGPVFWKRLSMIIVHYTPHHQPPSSYKRFSLLSPKGDPAAAGKPGPPGFPGKGAEGSVCPFILASPGPPLPVPPHGHHAACSVLWAHASQEQGVLGQPGKASEIPTREQSFPPKRKAQQKEGRPSVLCPRSPRTAVGEYCILSLQIQPVSGHIPG